MIWRAGFHLLARVKYKRQRENEIFERAKSAVEKQEVNQ